MAVILTKLLIIKLVSEIQCLIHWFFLLFYVGSSRLRAVVCWNALLTGNAKAQDGQPPSGGCVLKRRPVAKIRVNRGSSRLRAVVCWNCAIKQIDGDGDTQPPSGGCVLKPAYTVIISQASQAAAFGRLCVETRAAKRVGLGDFAAAFGRLCVETNLPFTSPLKLGGSRLRAVVCWNIDW